MLFATILLGTPRIQEARKQTSLFFLTSDEVAQTIDKYLSI